MTKKKVRTDMKVGEIKHRRLKSVPTIKHGIPQPGITI